MFEISKKVEESFKMEKNRERERLSHEKIGEIFCKINTITVL